MCGCRPVFKRKGTQRNTQRHAKGGFSFATFAETFASFALIFSLSSAPGKSSIARAQEPTGHRTGIEGVVVDQKGAPVAGAEVTLSASSFSASIKTDDAGRFLFDSAPRAA